MRRRPLPVAATAALVAAIAAFAAACGVTADTTAATVGGRVVEVDQVDALAGDEEFLEFGLGLAGAAPAEDSRIPGSTARAVLMFEIQRAAWFSELDRWGLVIDADARRAGEARLDQEIDLAGVAVSFSDDVRDAFIEYFAAQELLGERFARLDVDDEEDLRRLYESGSVLWERSCVEAVEFDVADLDAVRDRLERGADPAALAEELPTAQLVADPERSCVATSQIQADLRDAIDRAPEGEVSDVVLIDAGSVEVGYVFRVVERQQLSFTDARDDLEAIAVSLLQQGPANWINLVVSSAQVNPRYGSGISVDPSGLPVVDPPRTPLAPPRTAPEVPDDLELPLDELQLDDAPAAAR